jgi:tRNA pseudouridine(38-40) synthase
MTRRDKVELFEQIRREYEFGVGTIAGVARKFGVHRRMVRQALKNAIPPSRKLPQRNSPALDPVRDFIDQILIDDQKAPRKQRRTAFGKKYVWWVKDRLAVGEMARAAELVVGRHDFAAFSERDTKRDGQSTIVHVESAEITTDEHLIRFRITASHFLWKMVRRLIGSLVEVGRGRASVEDFARLIENPRSQSPLVPARVTAPPSGLFLESVDY